jgi:hypothetical protein
VRFCTPGKSLTWQGFTGCGEGVWGGAAEAPPPAHHCKKLKVFGRWRVLRQCAKSVILLLKSLGDYPVRFRERLLFAIFHEIVRRSRLTIFSGNNPDFPCRDWLILAGFA